MVGVACSFSVYTAWRSSTTATDLVWNTTRRDLLDENINHPAHIVDESEKHYNRGWLRSLSKVRPPARAARVARAAARWWLRRRLMRTDPCCCCLPAAAQVRGYSHVLPDVGVPKGEHAHS